MLLVCFLFIVIKCLGWPENLFPLTDYPLEYCKRINANKCINPIHFITDSSDNFFAAFIKHFIKAKNTVHQNDLDKLFKNEASPFKCNSLKFDCIWTQIQKDKTFPRNQQPFVANLWAQEGDLLDQGARLFSYFSLRKGVKLASTFSKINCLLHFIRVPEKSFAFVYRIETKIILKDMPQKDPFFLPVDLISVQLLVIDHCTCKKRMLERGVLAIPFRPVDLFSLHRFCPFQDPSLIYKRIPTVLPLVKKIARSHGYQALLHFFPNCRIRLIKFPYKTKVIEWRYKVKWSLLCASLAPVYVLEQLGSDLSQCNLLSDNGKGKFINGTYRLSCIWSYPDDQKPQVGSIYEPNQQIAKILVLDHNMPDSLLLKEHYLPWLQIYESHLLFHVILFQVMKEFLGDGTISHENLKHLLQSKLFYSFKINNPGVVPITSFYYLSSSCMYNISIQGIPFYVNSQTFHGIYINDFPNSNHLIVTFKGLSLE